MYGTIPQDPSEGTLNQEKVQNKMTYMKNANLHDYSMENYVTEKDSYEKEQNNISSEMKSHNVIASNKSFVENITDKNNETDHDTDGRTINNNNNNNNVDDNDNDNGEAGKEEMNCSVRENRIAATQQAASSLEAALSGIKETTKKMLNEIDSYLKVTQEVELDYLKCQKRQRSESRRLKEVSPAVTGITSRFCQQET